MRTDSVENFKRAWLHVARNRFLWPIAFFIALAGGGLESFSLWLQSPLGTGLVGASPLHRIGDRITDFARGNALFWGLFLGIGIAVGLIVVAFGCFAQASAIGGVAELEFGREADLRSSLGWGRYSYRRLFLLVIAYLAAVALFSLPFYVVTYATRSGLVFPCLAWLVLAAGFVVVSIVMGVVLQLSARFLVLDDLEIPAAVFAGWRLFRREWRDCLLTWLYVMLLSLAGVFVTGVLLAMLSTPLLPLFNASNTNHSPVLIMLGMLAFIAAWAIAAAVSGVFAITGSAMWTETYLDLK